MDPRCALKDAGLRAAAEKLREWNSSIVPRTEDAVRRRRAALRPIVQHIASSGAALQGEPPSTSAPRLVARAVAALVESGIAGGVRERALLAVAPLAPARGPPCPELVHLGVLDGAHRAAFWPPESVPPGRVASHAESAWMAGCSAVESAPGGDRRRDRLDERFVVAAAGVVGAARLEAMLRSPRFAPVPLAGGTLAALLSAAAARGDVEAALAAARVAAERAGGSDPRPYNWLLRSARFLPDPERAIETIRMLLDEMLQCGAPPDLHSFAECFASLQRLCASGKLTAVDVRDMVQYLDQHLPVGQLLPSALGRKRLLARPAALSVPRRRAALASGDTSAQVDSKLRLLANNIMACYARVGAIEEALDAVRMLETWGVAADEATFGALLTAVRRARPPNAEGIVERIGALAAEALGGLGDSTYRQLVSARLELGLLEDSVVTLRSWKDAARGAVGHNRAARLGGPTAVDYEVLALRGLAADSLQLAEALLADRERVHGPLPLSADFCRRARRLAASLRADKRRGMRAFLRRHGAAADDDVGL